MSVRNAVLLPFLLAFAVAPAAAEILDTGVDTEKVVEAPTVISPAAVCPILWVRDGGADAEVERLRALGLDIRIGGFAELNPEGLEPYGVVVVAYMQSGLLTQYRTALQDFVVSGGGLLIHQPNASGLLDYTPTGFDVTMISELWCSGGTESGTTIVNEEHPLTAGLLPEDLSGDFDEVGALGPGFTVLAENSVCGDPALAAGTLGLGRVVLETGNANLQSVDPGTEAYWDRLFGWLCTPGTIAVEPVSWGQTKAMYR